MKKLKSLDWTSIIIESILIVLSILLALGINQYRENNLRNELKISTIKSIKTELDNNLVELESLIKSHRDKSIKLSELLSNWEDDNFKHKPAIHIIGSLDKIVIKAPSLSTTAWETSKITDGLSLLDFNTVQNLSSIYNLQENSIQKVWEILAEFLLSKDMFGTDDTKLNLQVFQTYVNELYKQEEYLKQLIESELENTNWE